MANPLGAWKRFCGRLVLLLLLWQTQKIQVALADAPKDPPSSSSSASSLLLDNEDCNVFLAESSLPNAGRGVFVTRHYKRGEKIGPASLVIPMIDFEKGRPENGILDEYLWPPSNIGAWDEANRVDLYLTGIASMTNMHEFLANVVPGEVIKDEVTSWNSHPGAGAYSNYHRFHWIAKRDILPGEELFVAPGDEERKKWTELKSAKDYERADEIVHELVAADLNLTEAQWIDFFRRLKQEVLIDEQDSRVAELLPRTKRELHVASRDGTALVRATLRTPEWIGSNGQCLDNMRAKDSTIQSAGRGAFAERVISKGSIVVPAPLVFIANKTAVEMRDIGTSSHSNATHQLLLNYCFGHPHMDALLCPASDAVLINHSPKPNTRIQWAVDDSSDEARLGSLDQVHPEGNEFGAFNTRLVIEYVATRDILPNEEILVDYSLEWGSKFLNHAESFESVSKSDSIPAAVLNGKGNPLVVFDELNSSSHSYTHTYECQLYPEVKEYKNIEITLEEFSANRNMHYSDWPPEKQDWFRDNGPASWYPCRVVGKAAAPDSFIVQVFSKPLFDSHLMRHLNNCPRSRIRFSDRPYTSDLHSVDAFRRMMFFPVSLLPLHWRKDSVKSVFMHKETSTQDESSRDATAMEIETILRGVKCGAYLAPSTIENAGFGTYTSVDLPVGTDVSSTIVGIPEMRNIGEGKWAGDEYLWSSNDQGSTISYEASKSSDIMELVTMYGSLANSHTGIQNLDGLPAQFVPTLDRRVDPGAGAFTDYVGRVYRTNRAISAGDELFVDYGQHWFAMRAGFNAIPLRKNFDVAENFVSMLSSMISPAGSEVNEEDANKLLGIMIEGKSFIKEQRTRNALGYLKSVDDVKAVVARGGIAQTSVDIRSLDWLERHGRCIDHLYLNASTVRQAGQGAFTRRYIPKGDTIITSPLLPHFGDALLNGNRTQGLDLNPWKLIYNYHFKHPRSSLHLLPLSTAAGINHASTRTLDGPRPNARIQWAAWNRRSNYFLRRLLEDLEPEKSSTLVFDFVATRDILPDEEIFIDYGEEWETAWNNHVKNYKNPCRDQTQNESTCYKSSKFIQSMNNDKHNPQYHTWSEDHFILCKSEHFVKDPQTFIHLKKFDSSSFADAVSSKESYRGISFDDELFERHLSVNGERGRPCKVLSVNDDKTFDMAVPLTGGEKRHFKIGAEVKVLSLATLNATDIVYWNKPYTTDMFATSAFRHTIGIPDEIFPTLWKDEE